MRVPYANIHHFGNDTPYVDDHGEQLLGFYYEIIDQNGHILAPLFGPYANKAEVEAAAEREWSRVK